MIARVIIRPAAKRDIRDGRVWYRKISPVLADDFLEAVDQAITLAREYPQAFQVVHRTFRRILLRRFPYALFYDPREDRVIVVAVLHQARDPGLLDER
ncbi:MAG TPA: type II toxin-antitoxin system RelE/ParE family toxin [Thermoanaerobaculia bacterium]|nr:type II toxin-antitoxin system RelE/ParE family toxin [Thermoanaerobaculia bacterium]